MWKIEIRLQEISEAKRFYEILSNPNFIYFSANPKSVEDEENWLKESYKSLADWSQYNYTVLYDGEIAGWIWVKINAHRKYIGEIWYFIDEKFWWKGITTEAVKLLEKKCFSDLKLERIEIVMQPENIASEKVAIKAGYIKEWLLKKVLKDREGNLKDAYLYAKVL